MYARLKYLQKANKLWIDFAKSVILYCILKLNVQL